MVYFLLNFAYLYNLRLSSVYQIKLNNNRHQELYHSKQFIFIVTNKPLTFIWVDLISKYVYQGT